MQSIYNILKSDIVLIYKNQKVECLTFKSNNALLQNNVLLPINMLREKCSIEPATDVIFNSTVSVLNANTIKTNNIYYIYPDHDPYIEFFHRKPIVLDDIQNGSKHFFVIRNITQQFLDYYNCNYKNTKLLPGLVSFYGELSRHNCTPTSANTKIDADVFFNLNNHNYEKYQKLKEFNQILWTGRLHFNRKLTIEKLNTLTEFKIKCLDDPVNFNEKSYIDVLLEHQCFCSLSLDGSTAQCNRDTELGIAKIPNLKFTSMQENISANGSIYLARSESEYVSRVNEIREDIGKQNYSKLEKGFNYMKNLYVLKHSKPPLFSTFLEVILNRANIKYEDVLSNTKDLTQEQWTCYLENNITFC